MKYIKQFIIIIIISFIGEVLNYIIPFPIPASIYGMLIMFLCLKFGIFKNRAVKETGEFLIEIMPIMFIPAAVGLLISWKALKAMLPAVILVILLTIVVMAVTGLVTQRIIDNERKRIQEKEKNNG